jgi:hypothetical protein
VENLGMPMIYTLVDIVREWLLENNIAGQVRQPPFHECQVLVDTPEFTDVSG